MRVLLAAFVLSAALFSAGAEEPPLPEQDPTQPLEIEPPVLVPLRARDGSIPNPAGSVAAVNVDIAKLENELTRAEKRASGAERLFKAGIIAKMDAEQRALKVVQLKAQLAEARLQQAKAEAVQTNAVADVEAEAKRTAEERQRAEIEQAFRNLQRQQKLLALGSGRKADVNRAEQKLAELQASKN
jgi:hypothetical protein